MSHLLDRLNFFQNKELERFSDNHGQVTRENRDWEDTYRNRWRHDRIVRSTHGVNCTGSCSWKIYVKSGIVTWETQQTDYPRTRAGLPNHEPRGCARGASYSWYLYSANRVKNPLIRVRIVRVFGSIVIPLLDHQHCTSGQQWRHLRIVDVAVVPSGAPVGDLADLLSKPGRRIEHFQRRRVHATDDLGNGLCIKVCITGVFTLWRVD